MVTNMFDLKVFQLNPPLLTNLIVNYHHIINQFKLTYRI